VYNGYRTIPVPVNPCTTPIPMYHSNSRVTLHNPYITVLHLKLCTTTVHYCIPVLIYYTYTIPIPFLYSCSPVLTLYSCSPVLLPLYFSRTHFTTVLFLYTCTPLLPLYPCTRVVLLYTCKPVLLDDLCIPLLLLKRCRAPGLL
jgi:hypothetical protein